MPDPLPPDVAEAMRRLGDRRGYLGDPLYYFQETGSTNDVAAGYAERGARQGTTVVAAAQTSGRGRLGRSWYSPPGAGLYVSIVIRSSAATPYLTLAGGVAVAEGIRAATGLPRSELTKAIDELQKRMKVVPQEVVYIPKFTYIWTLSEARFPKELSKKMNREEAVRELARCYLEMCGMTLLGELSGKFGFYRWESGKANHELID